MNGNITFAWIISVLAVPLGTRREVWWAMVTPTQSTTALRVIAECADHGCGCTHQNDLYDCEKIMAETIMQALYWRAQFVLSQEQQYFNHLPLQVHNQETFYTCPLSFKQVLYSFNKKLVKRAFLFHSPHFLSLCINPLRWRANQFSLCTKRPGLRLQPSAQANITLCLLAPPTPPPHICLHLESFPSSHSRVVLKLLKR